MRECFREVEEQGYFEPLNRTFRTGLAYSATESRLVMNRGGAKATMYLDFTYLPLRNVSGDLEGILFQCVDVTDKQITRTKLERRVKERTADLEQARDNLRILNHALLQAQEEERRRLSVELHDSAGQWIVALRWKLSFLDRLREGGDRHLIDGLSDSLTMLDSLAQELRTVSYLLHPPLLEGSGLSDALRQLSEGLCDRSGLSVRLQIDPNLRRLPGDIEVTVFRIVQEALTNVRKLARANAATVQIAFVGGRIQLAVEDDGTGIAGFVSLESPNTRLGVGIQGMRERVRHLAGTFNIQSNQSGTVVSATLPANSNEVPNEN